MKKQGFLVVGILLFIGFGILFFQKNKSPEKDLVPVPNVEKKIQVVTTFYPLTFFAEQVGGEYINLVTLTPSGAEPHDYEPTPQDIIKIKTADVFVMNGANFEPWAEKLLPELSKVKVIEMSEHVDLLATTEEEHEDEEGDRHEEGEFDPHFWLDPIQARSEVQTLRDTFIALDVAHAEVFTQRAATLVNTLTQLDQSYAQGLTKCVQKEVITSHNAFNYVASRYGFSLHTLAGISPTQEPSPKHLAELTKIVREKKIQYIFTETLASPKFADTLAKEAHVKTLVLNPIEGLTEEDIKAGKNYESIMKENLQNLQLALECQ